MIRLQPPEAGDAAEEKKKVREIVVSNITTFFIIVGLIKLGKFNYGLSA